MTIKSHDERRTHAADEDSQFSIRIDSIRCDRDIENAMSLRRGGCGLADSAFGGAPAGGQAATLRSASSRRGRLRRPPSELVIDDTFSLPPTIPPTCLKIGQSLLPYSHYLNHHCVLDNNVWVLIHGERGVICINTREVVSPVLTVPQRFDPFGRSPSSPARGPDAL